MNLNKAFIVGRVTADIEVKATKGGMKVANFSMATNRTWTKDGEKHEEAEFHNIVAWGRTAEIIAEYSGKGAELLVEGRLQTRSWEDKNGNKRYTTEIVAESIQLGQKPGGKSASKAKPKEAEEIPELDPSNISDEDLPF